MRLDVPGPPGCAYKSTSLKVSCDTWTASLGPAYWTSNRRGLDSSSLATASGRPWLLAGPRYTRARGRGMVEEGHADDGARDRVTDLWATISSAERHEGRCSPA